MSDIDLNVYLRIIWKWLWLIVIATGLAAATGYCASRSLPKSYVSSVTLMVGEEPVGSRVSLEDLAVSQRVAATYAGMVRRQPVLEATVKALGLPTHWRELQNRVVAIRRDGSQLLEIRVTDTDPQRAKATTDEVARQLVLQSPTAQNMQQVEQRRDFVRRQLRALQTSIEQSEAAMAEKQAALAAEVSARGVLDLQDEMRALDLKLNSWRTTYATLLTVYEGKAPNTLSVVEPAYVPSAPVGPNVRAHVLMAAGTALLLALGAALLIEYFIDGERLVTAQDMTRVLGLAGLGSIARMGKLREPAEGLVAAREPHSPAAEAYRVLRTNVRFACRDEPSVALLVTSTGIGEGKSITSANLGASFAQAGKRTILVDADLRHPSLHTYFGVANDRGLASLLADDPTAAAAHDAERPGSAAQTLRRRLDDYLVSTDLPRLSVLPAGPLPPANPGELFASPVTGQVLEALRGAADVVILDSPPVLPVADTAILASMGPGVVLVVGAGQTRSRAARQAHEVLRQANARVLGAVLNKAARPGMPFYRYRDEGSRVNEQRAASSQ